MEKITASFRDPSGFVFRKNGDIYRKINECYKDTFYKFTHNGLYQELLNKNLIIPHVVVSEDIIKPEEIFISYPYEWSFEQYKDAALTTLYIQKIALDYNMCLKDATPYNIQFYKGSPVLIDTLSFEVFEEKPWVAYNQFCTMFLAPLALMSYRDHRLSCLMKNFISGIPLDLCAELLPLKSKMNIGLLLNIFSHARSQKKYEDNTKIDAKKIKITKQQHENIIKVLIDTIKGLSIKEKNTEWSDYYQHTNYQNQSFEFKKSTVRKYIEHISPQKMIDLGANTNIFSNIATDMGIQVYSLDIDYIAVNRSYKTAKKMNNKLLLPLVMDLTNPSPGIGWNNEERMSLLSRTKNIDCCMALALIHHLAISNNLPFEYIAQYFSRLSKFLIIEFVDKTDSQVQKLLFSREDIFNQYTKENFKLVFSKYFTIIKEDPIPFSNRILYLMSRKVD